MASTRVPLTEIGPQVPAHRARRKWYGKRTTMAAPQAKLWETPEKENNLSDALTKLNIKNSVENPSTRRSSEQATKEKRSHKEETLSKAGRAREERKITARSLDTAYVAPLLSQAEQEEIGSFSDFAKLLTKTFIVSKVAEGSYGEVYKLNTRASLSNPAAVTKIDKTGGCILKIVPLKPRYKKCAESFSTVQQVVREVKLLNKLDTLHGFTRFRGLNVLQGEFPESFLEAWRDFKNRGGDSVNQDPEKRFKSKQLYAIVEMDDAGQDLESLKTPDVFQIFDIFWSTTIILANAESAAQFEQRDGHVGNVCIRPFKPGGCIDVSPELVSKMAKPPTAYLGLSGIRTTIIDYTISRVTLDHEDGEVVFSSLTGDPIMNAKATTVEESYQYSAYRGMRDAVLAAAERACGQDEGVELDDPWSRFVPKTNVVWLEYLLRVLLDRAKGRVVKESNAISRNAQAGLRAKLHSTLKALDGLSSPESAGELVELAKKRLWLREDDMKEFMDNLESVA